MKPKKIKIMRKAQSKAFEKFYQDLGTEFIVKIG